MKFDKIIMNPPYKGKLHLKILNKVNNYLESNGQLINLSPILWAQVEDYFDKKDEYLIPKNVNDIDIIKKELAQKYFVRNPTDLGIYNINNNTDKLVLNQFKMMGFNNYNIISSIYNKIKNKMPSNFKLNISGRTKLLENYSIIYSHMSGLNSNHDFVYINGIGKNGKSYKENVKNQHKNETSTHFEFNSYDEAENFRLSLHTIFFRFIELITQPSLLRFLHHLPFMEDYTQPWTNERFCNYFGVTGFISDTEAEPGSEWEEILNTMKDYV